jgi:hypothetical protein
LQEAIVEQREYPVAMYADLSPPYLLELTCGEVVDVRDERSRPEFKPRLRALTL